MEDMGGNPARETATCGHARVGQTENTHVAQVGDQYAARHDPFVFFHSIIDDQARCDDHVVNLERLTADLSLPASTANYIFITPNLCHDGHDAHCVDGQPGGLAAIDGFLRKWVPLITGSPAFRADGMLVVTFDESDRGGASGAAACWWRATAARREVPAGIQRSGWRAHRRRSAAIAIRETRDRVYGALQPLRAARHGRVDFRPGAAGLRGSEPELKVFGTDVFSAAAPHPPSR